jgi:hypothetical protein
MGDTLSFEDIKFRKKEGKIMHRKATLSQEVKKSIYLLIFTLLGIIVLLSIVFLLNTSQATQKGYILQQQQVDKEDFLSKNRELIEKIIQAQAYKTIQEKIAGKNMQPPQGLTYIQDPNAAATKKK